MALVGWSDLEGNGGLKIQWQSAENQMGTDGYWFGLMGDTHWQDLTLYQVKQISIETSRNINIQGTLNHSHYKPAEPFIHIS